MNPEEKAAYICKYCLKAFPPGDLIFNGDTDDAACSGCVQSGCGTEVWKLRQQINKLQQEAVEQAALVERLKRAIRIDAENRMGKANANNQTYDWLLDREHEPYTDWSQWVGDETEQALSQSPPTGFGARMLELGRADFALEKAAVEYSRVIMGHDDGEIQAKEQAHKQAEEAREAALEAITKEYLEWIGGEG